MILNISKYSKNGDFLYSSFFMASLIFQVIQIGIYPILLSQIMNGYAYSNFQIGVILSISWMSVFVLGPFVPKLLGRFGHNYIVLTSFLATIISIGLLLIFDNLGMLTLSSLLMGCGLIFRWISCDTVLVEVTESSSTGRLIGIHEALMGLGIALGPLFFIYLDIWSVAWACIILAAIGQVGFSFARIPRAAATGSETDAAGVWLVCRVIMLALAAAFVAGFIESSSIALLPLHFENFGYPLASSAVLVSAFGFGGTLLQPPLGYLSDRKGYTFAQILCLVGCECGLRRDRAAADEFCDHAGGPVHRRRGRRRLEHARGHRSWPDP